MKILITICARGGSKGIPWKNIKLLNGFPLIYYTIRVAQQFQQKFENVHVVLSTDSLEIMKVAENFELKAAYRRPDFLSGDSVGKIDVINDVLVWQEDAANCKYDYILDLDVTSPLRNLQDLADAFKIIQKNDKAINLFSVSPASKSPYFNMIEQKDNGFFALVKESGNLVVTRQAAYRVFDMNASFYYYKRAFFNLKYKSAVTDKSLIYIVPHTCFDIDHPIDFEIISYLMTNNKLDFVL